MLTKGDDFPIHQTPEPIAFSGTDRNFYDRYFFNGAQADGSGFFALAFGVYPHLNIMDAHFSVLRDGRQTALHASRILGLERLDLEVGPIRIEVLEPLRRLRLHVGGDHGIRAELTCQARSSPLQEPRFTRRIGPRVLMDLTRFTQGVRWTGYIELDGARIDYHDAASLGVRDRSWGVRPIGEPDRQPHVPAVAPQFYWLWAPTAFQTSTLFAHVNEDARGTVWNTRAALLKDGAEADQALDLAGARFQAAWTPGSRFAHSAVLEARDPSGRSHEVRWSAVDRFQMKGLGYGHPTWAHGVFKGPQVVEREDFRPADLDPLALENLHVQAICRARHEGEGGLLGEGVGVLEQLVIGPHAPSGFVGLCDGARD